MGSRLESKSTAVRKRIENHTFEDEAGDEYEGSKFGGFSDYFRRKKIKLQNLDVDLRARSGDKPQIFRGIVAHINGYTQPSLNDLHEMIVSHGGGFIQYLDGKTMVTHIIASNLTPKKAVEFKRYRIVKPAWIVDSVEAGRLLPWNEYRVIDEGVGQKVLGFDKGQVVSQVNVKTKGYRDQTANSWYTSQFKKGSSSAAQESIEVPPEQTQSLQPSANYSFDESDFERLDEATRQAEAQVPLDQSHEEEVQQNQPSVQDDGGVGSEPQSPDVDPAPNEAEAPPPLSDGDEYGNPPDETVLEPNEAPGDHLGKRARSPSGDSPRKAAKLTAEEHNSILLADPRIRKSTVVNPDFLEQYYRESRLHHLSTWKADLKSQLRALTEEKTSSQLARQKRPSGARRYVMHVDFDSFFVAVSLKKCPHLAEKPCAVAHGGGSGSEIASCNYPARKFGIKNGMWMKKAHELCKELEILPYDFPAYEAASRKFYDAILATGGIVQSVSIDEALIDVSVLCASARGATTNDSLVVCQEQDKADEIAQQLRTKVLEDTGCNVSVGIGANILLAKIALRKAKPAGQFHLKPEQVLDIIGELEVQDLPGVAWSLGGRLEEIGIKLVKDIRDQTKEKLMTKLGPKTGEKLWDYAKGIDRVEVGDVVIRKSVSAEVNWGVRFENQDQVDEFMESLCGELHKRLLKERVKGRQLTIKIMRRSADAPLDPPKHLGHGKCDTYNKSIQLGVCTNDAATISKEALSVMRGLGFSPGELRGIGVQMQKLEPIKTDNAAQGSQRRLQFKQPAENEIKYKPDKSADSIDEVETPKALRVRDMTMSAIPMKLMGDSPSKKPLNILGTQFVLPTQVDPAVLAELPEDIRSKLIRHVQPSTETINESADNHATDKSSTDFSESAPIPRHSQLDAETLAALPEDVRAEVLGFYKSQANAGKQALLPQSPRKVRIIPPPKPAPARRGRGRGGLFGSMRASRSADTATLTQSNFIARPAARLAMEDVDSGAESDATLPELDAEFLAALPPELRQEVIDNHRQERLRRVGGIDLSMHHKPQSRKAQKQNQQAAVDRLFKLPARPPKPTFTKAGLSELPDLRDMIRNWVDEFWDEEPFTEDVDVMIDYLRDVIAVEGNLDKAVRVVKWLGWLVEEDSEDRWQGDAMRSKWEKALRSVREGVQDAVAARGLARVEFV